MQSQFNINNSTNLEGTQDPKGYMGETGAALSKLEALRREANEPNQRNITDYLEREQVGDAELLRDILRGCIGYDHSAKAWYINRGHYWTRDRNGEMKRLFIERLAPEYMQAAADALRVGDKDLSKKLQDRARDLMKLDRMKKVLEIAANLEGVTMTGDEWDCNPMLLATRNGVLDLRTGVLRAAQPGEYLRVFAPVDWQGLHAPAAKFEETIQQIFGNDGELVNFIQRLFGYCITGKTTEHRLPILYGEQGRNGKTTLVQTIAAAMGNDLSHTTQADALMESRRDGNAAQPFVYALRGKRLVWATESNEGRRVNAGLVKQLTGGDIITTRTLNEKPVTFAPSHKVMLLTNHKPHMSAEDQALWDRVLLIPFNNRFVDEPSAPNEYKRDRQLEEKLRDELPGILAWLVRGCLLWQRDGLNPPACVLNATEEYRAEEDTLGEFINECLYIGDGAQAHAKDIYSVYDAWARAGNIDPMTQTSFGKKLKKRPGITTKNTNKGVLYMGVGVLQNER